MTEKPKTSPISRESVAKRNTLSTTPIRKQQISSNSMSGNTSRSTTPSRPTINRSTTKPVGRITTGGHQDTRRPNSSLNTNRSTGSSHRSTNSSHITNRRSESRSTTQKGGDAYRESTNRGEHRATQTRSTQTRPTQPRSEQDQIKPRQTRPAQPRSSGFGQRVPRGGRKSFDSRKTTEKIVKVIPGKKGVLRVWPLGGNDEVGRNSTVFEYGDDIIILDMGYMFPEEDMPGVDYIIPNIESLKGKEKNIRAIVLSHGHMDHIGALPYVMPKLGNPTLVGSDMTLALVKKRHDEFPNNPPLRTITIKKEGEDISLGAFKINFFTVAHSVREAFGVVIQTSDINFIHMGDWRYDLEPVGGDPSDFSHLKKWNTKKKPSVLAFESLGATRDGYQVSESRAYEATGEAIKNAPGRIIFGTFSSMLERVGQIIELAEKYGRKIAVDGYSMKTSIEIGKQFGYIKAKSPAFIDIKQVSNYPPNKICIVATGSQADERSVLMRIANHEHRYIEIEPEDTVVFSSSVIPGNERVVQRLKDVLYRQGANVIHKEIVDAIHGGGHAKRDDIRLLLKQVSPKYVMPVFANYYILKECEKLVVSEGWRPEDVFVIDNGRVVEFDSKGLKVTKEKMNTDYVIVDGLGVGDVSHVVIKDRQMLSADGMVVVIATVRAKTGKLVQNPDIISRGFVHLKENREMVEALRHKARKVVMDNYDPRTPAQDYFIKNQLRTEIGKFILQKTQRRPMILPVVIEV